MAESITRMIMFILRRVTSIIQRDVRLRNYSLLLLDKSGILNPLSAIVEAGGTTSESSALDELHLKGDGEISCLPEWKFRSSEKVLCLNLRSQNWSEKLVTESPSAPWLAFSLNEMDEQGLRPALSQLVLIGHKALATFEKKGEQWIRLAAKDDKSNLQVCSDQVLMAPSWFFDEFPHELPMACPFCLDGSEHDKSTQETPIVRNVLVVSPIQGGGTKVAVEDLIFSLSDLTKVFELRFATSKLKFFRVDRFEREEVFKATLKSRVSLLRPNNFEYDIAVARFCVQNRISSVVITHFAWQSLSLTGILKQLGIYCTIDVHDYYPICPSYLLINSDGEFCGGDCGGIRGNCESSIWPTPQTANLRNNGVFLWRDHMSKAIADSDFAFVPDTKARDLLCKYFPNELRDKILVSPHPLNLWPNLYARSGPTEKIRVLILGDISKAKGRLLLSKIIEAGDAAGLEFVVAGEKWSWHGARNLQFKGPYDRANLMTLIESWSVNVALFPNISPETYSYTVREALYAGVPIVSSNIGANATILESFRVGEMVDVASEAEAWIQAILRVANQDFFAEISRFVAESEDLTRKLFEQKVLKISGL